MSDFEIRIFFKGSEARCNGGIVRIHCVVGGAQFIPGQGIVFIQISSRAARRLRFMWEFEFQPIGDVPPAEYEMAYYRQQDESAMAA